MEFWNQLACEYESLASLVDVWLNFNKREDKILLLWPPDWHYIIGRVWFLVRIALHALYAGIRRVNLFWKRKNTLVLYSWASWVLYELIWLNWNKKKKRHRGSFSKLTISSFFSILCFHFLAFMEILALTRLWVCAISFPCLCVTKF